MKRDVAKVTSLFCLLVLLGNVMGQAPCGSDQAHVQLMGHSALYQSKHATFDNVWNDIHANNGPTIAVLPNDSNTQVFTLPVVVHVIHVGSELGRAENISDAQIFSAIAALNDDFRKVEGTSGDGLGVDTEIQFALAKRDPAGQPTSGIVRIDGSGVPGYATGGISSLSIFDGADEAAVKGLTSWMGDAYINIFVVPEIDGNDGAGGVQGFAYTGPTGDVLDGITLLYNVIGTEGILKPGRDMNRTLTHEMGHHLGLWHTFWNTSSCNEEDDCLVSGDQVCDTPVTFENDNCSAATCPDAQLENYMDYTLQTCKNTFTAGQRDRMRASLESVRASLLMSEGAVPVVQHDLALDVPMPNTVCGTMWAPALRVSNLGVAEVSGFQIQATWNGDSLAPITFENAISPGHTVTVHWPETELITAANDWMYQVLPIEGGVDEYAGNDTSSCVFDIAPMEQWTMSYNLDAFSNEVSWILVDSIGQTVDAATNFPPGGGAYEDVFCLDLGCYTLTIEDAAGDGWAFGGDMCLVNSAGDTLASIPPGDSNFGSSVTFQACVESVLQPPTEQACHDFNGNGTCDELELSGCTYPQAFNFDPGASMDDGSCLLTCPGDFNGDAQVQLTDLLEFLAVLGLPCEP